MTGKCVIREAKDADSQEVISLIFDIWVNEYQFNVKTESYPDLYNIKQYYFESGGLFLVAVISNEIVGTIACDQLDDSDFVLKRMFVKQAFRGKGITQQLLDALLNRLFKNQNSAKSIYLSTKEDQATAAKHFYLKNRFEVIEKSKLPKTFPFFYEDDLFMCKEVNYPGEDVS